MGNCFALCRPRRNSWTQPAPAANNEKVLRVVNSGGKILEYTKPMLVKDILVNSSGHGVGISAESSRTLPPNYELKIGHFHHLLPPSGDFRPPTPAGSSPCSADTDRETGFKRVKVIITKQQLGELLSRRISAEEMLLGLQKQAWEYGVDSSRGWRPLLETIHEESEQGFVMQI